MSITLDPLPKRILKIKGKMGIEKSQNNQIRYEDLA